MRICKPIAAAICAALSVTPALAYEAGDWTARLGLHHIEPKDHNHEVVSVDASTGVTASVAYFATPTIALDLLVALPFEHDITLNADGSTVGTTQHLPPTLSVMWYPRLSDHWQPFLGVGLNYTVFFEEETEGALTGSRLQLDESFGAAFAAGLEYMLTPGFSLVFDVRYMEIESDAKLDGAALGEVEIDPVAVGFSVGYRF